MLVFSEPPYFRELTSYIYLALTCCQIELRLSDTKLASRGQTGQVAWISKGLKIEESQ